VSVPEALDDEPPLLLQAPTAAAVATANPSANTRFV
jgi:hypothetical protein